MYQLQLADKVRRYIGDRLLAHDGKTASISVISRTTDISRVTLTKWANDDRRLYWLTKHIDDEELQKRAKNPYLVGDSMFFDHAVAYCRRVIGIRADAASGALGPEWQREERDRIRAQDSKR